MTDRATLITKLERNGYKYRVTELNGLELLDKTSDPVGAFVINDNYTIVDKFTTPDLCEFIRDDIERAEMYGYRRCYSN